MLHRLISALAFIGALAAPMTGFANDGDASVSIRIFGFVPVICRAELQGGISDLGNGQVRLGRINGFCNAPGDYRIVVQYAGQGDLGALIVDGRKVQLDGSGRAVLLDAHGPGQNSHDLHYLPGEDSITSLRIQVETSVV